MTKAPYGGPSVNAIVLGANRAGSTPLNESVTEEEDAVENFHRLRSNFEKCPSGARWRTIWFGTGSDTGVNKIKCLKNANIMVDFGQYSESIKSDNTGQIK